MPRPATSQQSIDEIGSYAAGGSEREVTAFERWEAGWRPHLNPTQLLASQSEAWYKLYHSERASGKSTGALHELVEHAFLNSNALCVIIVGVRRQASAGGAWHKLQQEILPTWKDGNKVIVKGKWTGERHDEGIGIEFTETQTNVEKDTFLWVENRFGGWSQVLLLSMPVEKWVVDRVKGMEPSFVLIDEAQTLESDTYFKSIVQQVFRRPGISTRQQVIYCANPDGPSHWLYKRFWITPIDPETKEWNKRYEKFHIPIEENLNNIPPEYWESLQDAVKGDQVEEARMVRGEWVDRASGKALFGEDFKRELHVMGDAIKGRGILPNKDYPINFSYDLGQAHTSISLQQIIPTKDKIWKIVVDEMDFVGQYIPYAKLVPRIIARMMYWDDFKLKDGSKIGPFKFKHISDNSAFNQYRAKDGSFDAYDIQEISREYVALKQPEFFARWVKETGNPGRITFDKWKIEDKGAYSDKYVIRMLECPKGQHSIEARVRLLKDAMQQEEYLVSAVCVRTIEMLDKIEEDEKERLKPKRDRVQIHRFDSGSYGFFYYGPGRGRNNFKTAPVDSGPRFYVCGRGK